jgi:hypothetical protein
MPQPLRQPTILVMGHSVMKDRPDLAKDIATVVSQWSLLESLYSIILAMMAEPDPELVILIQNAIVGTGASDAMLRAVASAKLSTRLQDQLTKALTTTRQRARERNTIAHGVWATSEDYPRALILLDPVDLARQQIRAMLKAAVAGKRRKSKPVMWSGTIWSANDFRDALGRIAEHGHSLITLANEVAKETGHVPPDEPQGS